MRYISLFFCFSILGLQSLFAASIDEYDPILASVKALATPRKPHAFIRVNTPTSYGDESANCLLKKDRTALVILFPGIFSSRYSDDNQARAEMFYEGGLNVCVFSNSFRIGFAQDYRIIPGDLKAEGSLYWQASRSLLIQLKKFSKRIHFASFSYGTQILKEVLPHLYKEHRWLKRNRLIEAELGGAVFISPPYSLLESMHSIDSLWKAKNPHLRGVGTLPLIQLSFDVLNYALKGKELSRNTPVEQYQAFVLKMGFYEGVQEVAKDILKENILLEDPGFNFEDYLEYIYNPVHRGNLYSPLFTDGWEQWSMPSLIIYAEDDFINSPENVQKFASISSQNAHVRILRLNKGSHMGFINKPEIQAHITDFLAEK